MGSGKLFVVLQAVDFWELIDDSCRLVRERGVVGSGKSRRNVFAIGRDAGDARKNGIKNHVDLRFLSRLELDGGGGRT